MNNTMKYDSILVVDDNKYALDQLVKVFDNLFEKVFAASGYDEAMEYFKSNDIGVVVTDYDMPGKDGLELSRDIMEAKPDVAVVLISALDDKNMLKEAIRIGVKQYVAKPIEPQQLIHTVEYILSNRNLEQKAEENRKLFENIFNNSKEGILISDSNNRVISCNKAFETITGYTSEEVIGGSPNILKSGKHDEMFYKQMWKSLCEDGVWRGNLFNRRKDGSIYYEFINITAIKDKAGKVVNYMAVFSDFNQKQQDDEVYRIAYYDMLTNLPNRFYFNEILRKSTISCLREGKKLAILYFDLNGFKKVNDYHGHHTGDKLLCEVAEAMGKITRGADFLSRLGGDEFAMIITESNDDVSIENVCKIICEKIRSVFENPFKIDGKEILTSASIGVSIYPKDADNTGDLIKFADLAMYNAKKTKCDSYCFYNEEINKAIVSDLRIEQILAEKNKDDHFTLYFQPQVDSLRQTVVSAEVLIRLKKQEDSDISIPDLIRVAESSGHISNLDLWVLTKAAHYKNELLEKGIDIPLSVNLSAKTVEDSQNVDAIIKVLSEDYPGGGVILELIESALLKNTDNINKLIEYTSRNNVDIAIDDFGTGYSSLSYLKNIKAHALKIDKSFIDDLISDKSAYVITDSVIKMANALGILTVAEGVELSEQNDQLTEMNCNIIQGYYYQRPQDFDLFLDYLKQSKVKPRR